MTDMDMVGSKMRTLAPKLGCVELVATVLVDTNTSWRALKSPSLLPATVTWVRRQVKMMIADKATLLKIRSAFSTKLGGSRACCKCWGDGDIAAVETVNVVPRVPGVVDAVEIEIIVPGATLLSELVRRMALLYW